MSVDCKPLVSVIIPTYNRCEYVCKLIDSILESDYKEWECIIVDNASTDETGSKLKKRFHDSRIKYILLKENYMAAGGRNAGIKEAKGELLLFIDNDNVISSNMITVLVKSITEKNAGLMGAMTVNVRDNKRTIWATKITFNKYTSRFLVCNSDVDYPLYGLDQFYDTLSVPNCFMVSKDAIKDIGGFDKQYFAMYEESDFSFRLIRAGYKAYICTEALTYHYGALSKGESSELRFLGIEQSLRAYHFSKNRSIFMKKYTDSFIQKLVFFLIFSNVFTVYYVYKALKNKRSDIAKYIIKGTVCGYFTKVSKEIYVPIGEMVYNETTILA